MNILLCLMLVEGWHQESSEHKAGILGTFFLREISWGLVGVALVQKRGFPFRWAE
ncbi:hypothetical protein LINPERHAP1_LOCUS21626 [Linum perenne]